jgi:hypothetical protein
VFYNLAPINILIMGLKYDQRTLNRVLKHLKERKANLEITKWGFKKESKRYLSIGDKQNFARTARIVECTSFTIDEIDALYGELQEIFSGKTNLKKKEINKV